MGQRGDAATALVEADYGVDAAAGTGANGPADVGGSWRTSAASSARAEPAAGPATAKETVDEGCAVATGLWPVFGCTACLRQADGPQGRGYRRLRY